MSQCILRCSGQKTGRWRRFHHAFKIHSISKKRIDIPAERPMDEPDVHILFNFLYRLCLYEIWTYSPILFRRINDVVVYPATSRSLQQRMIQKETELAVRFQHSCHFCHCFVHLVNVLKHQTRNYCIKGLVIGRNLCSATKNVSRPSATFDCYINM